ncbi:flagellar filament capping protein FliD [Niveibacterium terrae]|uniref:flagellar filament capping protein FliD n=1 Tax=Niveibacterium terrae TaxID=3373598 RepID=UPI003A8EB764
MASISSLGAGSGLDLEGLVTKLMATEQQPVTLLQSKESKVLAKVSAYGQIKSTVSSLQDAASALASKAIYSATSATSSSSAVVSAASTSSAAAGSYSVTVNALAQGQRISSAAGSTPSVSAGSLTIQLGTYTTTSGTTSFTAASPAATAIKFSGSSLTDLRDAINAAKTGVTASIVNDGGNSRLVLQSDGMGKATAFKLTGTDGLSSLSFDASTGASSSFTSLQTAQDASINVQGIDITRSSNTITDAIDGVTLTLNSTSSTAATIKIAKDSSQATTLINSFIDAYNASVSTISSLTSYDSTNKVSSTLTGDSSAKGIRNMLRSTVTQGITLSDGSTMRLSDLGISLQKDGTLKLETASKLSSALSTKADKVAEFFAGTNTTKGLSSLVNTTTKSMIGVGGSLVGTVDNLNSSVKDIDKQIANWNVRLTAIEKRYRAQFSALDTAISGMKSTSSYLTQQLTALSKLNSSN